MKYRIFISSVQDEFAAERRKLKEWLKSDPFISRFVESVFLFEDVPAKGRAPSDVYLDEVARVMEFTKRGEAVKRLRQARRLQRVGGKKLGHLEVLQ